VEADDAKAWLDQYPRGEGEGEGDFLWGLDQKVQHETV